MIAVIKLTKEGKVILKDRFIIFVLSFWALFGFEFMLHYDIQEITKHLEETFIEVQKQKIRESLSKN